MAISKSVEPVETRSVEQVFRDAMSYIPIQDHLIKAYNDAGMYAITSPENLRWRTPTFLVPVKVRKAVDTKTLVAHVKLEIMKARQAVEGVRSILNREAEQLICHSPDLPYDHLHESVVVAHDTRPGYAPTWSYTYHPYLLAIATLNEYEDFIDRVTQRRLASFTKLARILKKAKSLETNTSLAAREMYWFKLTQ